MGKINEFLETLNKIEKNNPNIENEDYFFYSSGNPENKYKYVGWVLYNIVSEVRYKREKNINPAIIICLKETGEIIKKVELMKDNPFVLLSFLTNP